MVLDAIQRANSVAGRLKRLFSKEDGQSESKTDSRADSTVELAQNATTALNSKPQPSSMRITDQIIEEVMFFFCKIYQKKTN